MRALALALGLVVVGCGGDESAPRPTLHVAAAASLSDVMPELAASFERAHEVDVALRFGASSTLARQIEEGAPADVLVSADPAWIDALIDGGLARGEDRQVIATNALVAIVPADATEMPRDLRALVALPHLAVAGAEVPAGMHARTALGRSGVLDGAHLALAADVRAALAWVARGEAEGGIVYATDARIEPRVRVAFALSPSTHDAIVLEAIAVRDPSVEHPPERTDAARDFVTFLGSPESRATLAAAGFGPPP